MKKILVTVLMLTLSVPAFAIQLDFAGGEGKVDIYGQIRMYGLYHNVNQSGTGITSGQQVPQTGDNNDFLFGIQSNSRLGFKVSYGNFFSTAVLGYNGDGGVSLFRQLFIGYKFENGLTVSVGRQYTAAITYLEYDNIFDVDNGMMGYGTLGGLARLPSVKLSFANIDLLLVSQDAYYVRYPAGSLSGNVDVTGAPTGTFAVPISADLAVADKIMPAIELAYNINMGLLKGKIFGSYTGVTMQANLTSPIAGVPTQRAWVQSASAGFFLKYAQPKGFDAVLSAFYALNGQITGKVKWGQDGAFPGATLSLNDITATNAGMGNYNGIFAGIGDIHAWGAALSAGYNLTDSFYLAIGGGFQSISGASNPAFDDYGLFNSYAAYIVGKYKFNKYFMILPTVGYYNNYNTGETKIDSAGQSNNKLERATGKLIAGVQLRLMF